MDMDYDIPLPEELESLEADSYHHDHQEYYPDLDLPEQDPPDSPPSTDPQISGQNKRPRSECTDSPIEDSELPSDEKRSRVVDGEEEEEEEDRHRYSPPPEVEQEEVRVVEEENILSRYAFQIDGECMPVTAPGGNRVYAKISRFETEERLKKMNFKTHSNGLISEPFNVLLEKLEQEAFTKALNSSSESQSDTSLPEKQVVHEQLWVDKYSPNSFTELLSDEQTNREVLLWLKQWDSRVFGSEIRTTSDEVLSALKRHSSIVQHQKSNNSNLPRNNWGHKWSNGNFRHSNNSENEHSNSKGIQDLWNKKTRLTGPPEQKILLLCGPPGLGKTTLAHVAAKHCGYRVVEINASDDRSSSNIETKILDVVQMNSVMADARPKCLVIDEIDGALGDGKGAVEVILKMVSDERKNDIGKDNVAKEEQSGKTSSKKRRKTTSLSRPVKCFDCLGVSDLMHQYVMRTQKMALLVYQPSLAITVHRLVAQIQKANIEWPKSYQRYRTILIGKMDIFKSWHFKIPPYISRHLSTKSFVEELISPLLHILSPPTLRPVALHILSEKEKNDMAQLVRAMVAYCITYKNMRSDPLPNNLGHEVALEASALSFDPPIGDFINFKGYLSGHYELSLAMKQVLVHEVEKQRIMQVSIGKSLHLTNGQKENHDLMGKGSSKAESTTIGHSAACVADKRGDAKNVFNPRQCNPSTHTALSTLDSSRSASTSMKLKFSGDKKKPSNGSANFFDRYFLAHMCIYAAYCFICLLQSLCL
ncbi:hypothetical protein LWI29_021036 [Acer saccharum]|uniref:AAA+ ATPase domain-containing protein n=1 Tax=Acer saccharum TaxID=4024 RepID=A0AA39TLT7_ACESA|nr:hypothetical protein LWI29_021036 [Acer saccharum]